MLQTRRSENGDRVGFGGRSYVTVETGRKSYGDEFDDYLGFIATIQVPDTGRADERGG